MKPSHWILITSTVLQLMFLFGAFDKWSLVLGIIGVCVGTIVSLTGK